MSNEPSYTRNLNLLKAQDRWGTEDELTKLNGNWDIIDNNLDPTLSDIASVEVFVDKDFKLQIPETNDTARMQRAIDYAIKNSTVTSTSYAPINIPTAGNGAKIILSANKTYNVDTLHLKDFIELEGKGYGSTQIIVSGSIIYETAFNTSFDTVWGLAIRHLRLTGATGNEVLVKPGTTDSIFATQDQVLTQCKFERVLFEHAKIGFDLRGWNNNFDNCLFRDLEVGLNLDTAKKRTTPNTLTGNPGDNLFSRCDFNNCSYSVKMKHAKGNLFLDCAAYQADYIHYLMGEGCNGNMFIGGRAEDATQYLVLVDGGRLVTVNGTVYQCIKNHIADATNQPEVGGSWQTYWQATTVWTTDRTWVTGTAYNVTEAIKNIFHGFDMYIGASSRTGRNGVALTRSATFKFIKLQGDQYTTFEDCWSGGYVDYHIDINDKSLNATLTNNMSITADWTGTGTPTFTETYQSYGSDAKLYNNSIALANLKKLILKGDPSTGTDYYWNYLTSSPRRFSFKSDTVESLNVREATGLVHLPQNTFIRDLAQSATSTVITVTNVSTTDVVMITPRNATAATFYQANLATIYAVPENNDKIRIYHPNTAPASCTFNVIIL